MKTIIAGSRNIRHQEYINFAIDNSKFFPTEIVSGGCKGVDKMGEIWAEEHNIPVKCFPAEWNNVSCPGAIVKHNCYGNLYNTAAGAQRNAKMAKCADALIAIWDGKSKGTENMILLAKENKLKIFILII